MAHVESGLRSFDLTMPEEHNRRVADHLSAVLLAHSDERDREPRERGDHRRGAPRRQHDDRFAARCIWRRARALQPWDDLGVERGCYALVTLHRPALVDDHDRLAATVEGLIALAQTVPVVFPVHPRTRARLEHQGLVARLGAAGVGVVPPLGYLAFLGLEAEAQLVLTDSGGVQEETSVLGIRCFTLRDSTERPVTVELGTNTLLGARPEAIAEIPSLLAQSKPAHEIRSGTAQQESAQRRCCSKR